MGSPIYADYRPEHDASCVARLRAAGAYVFGKTVTTPFAFLDPGKTRNPLNVEHTPGGSSSGSAAAVAAGHVIATVGTQTNGSIIRPAAYCGVVGFKPTVGTIPIVGVHPFSPTLDTVGTFAQFVRDAGFLASVLAESGRIASEVVPATHRPRLAWLARFPWSEADAASMQVLTQALDRLRDGAEIVPIAIPEAWSDMKNIHRTIMLREGFDVLGELQEREHASPHARRSMPRSTKDARSSLRRYRDACVERERGDRVLHGMARRVRCGACARGAGHRAARARHARATRRAARCGRCWAFPSLNLPAGNVDRLPVGLQLAAPQGRDDTLLAAAVWCEARLRFAIRRRHRRAHDGGR